MVSQEEKVRKLYAHAPLFSEIHIDEVPLGKRDLEVVSPSWIGRIALNDVRTAVTVTTLCTTDTENLFKSSLFYLDFRRKISFFHFYVSKIKLLPFLL